MKLYTIIERFQEMVGGVKKERISIVMLTEDENKAAQAFNQSDRYELYESVQVKKTVKKVEVVRT